MQFSAPSVQNLPLTASTKLQPSVPIYLLPFF